MVLPHALTKRAILLAAGAGHHADEAATDAGQAAQVFLRGQFAVRHVDEVDSLEQPAQALMVLPVQAIIGLIAAIDLMHQRHRTVRRHRHAQDQLFEVRPMILIVAVRDLRGALGRGIGPVERDRRRVVVKPLRGELKLLDEP